MTRHTTRRFTRTALICLVGLAAGLGGCVNQQDYDRLVIENRTLLNRNQELNASLETLSTAQSDLQNKNSELQTIINQLRDQLSTAESERRTAQDEARTAQESIARLEQEGKDANEALAAQEAANQALRDQLDSSQTALAMYQDKHGPLPEATMMMKSVSGVVQAVDNEMDIYVVSVGSQDGVKVGYEFTVYRGDQYIATIVVDKVFPNHASARTKDNMKRKAARAGDNVRSQLLRTEHNTMSDMDYADDDYVDEGAGLANGVVVVTGLVMIVAIYLMLKALADQYSMGMLA